MVQSLEIRIKESDKNSLFKYPKDQGIEKSDIEFLKQTLKERSYPENIGNLGNNINKWIAKMVTKAADGTWNIGVATAGGVLATAINKFYGN